MSSKKTYRLPKRLADAVSRDYKQQGMDSENQYVIKALEHFLICKDGMSQSQMKLIVLQYPANCKRCDKHIEAGNWALYGRGVGAICMDCYVEKIGDKALIAKWLKMRELKQVVKALRAEAERLAVNVEVGKVAEYIEKMKEKTTIMYSRLMSYFRAMGNIDERQQLEELMRVIKEQEKTMELVKNFFERKVKSKSEAMIY